MTPLTSHPLTLSQDELVSLAEGRHAHPHHVLGAHPVPTTGRNRANTLIRVVRPLAEAVLAILPDGVETPLAHEGHGIWSGLANGAVSAYRIRARYSDGNEWEDEDPYRFPVSLGELDLYLIDEGRHEQLWQVLGAHVRTIEGVTGVSFSVWAPRATAVQVLGDFNNWDGGRHAMRRLPGVGVWELFVPGLHAGALYKFNILGADGHWHKKADPMAQATEAPPATASRVWESRYQWNDSDWLASRAAQNPHLGPMSVYEMHLGSWRPGLGYRELAEQLIDYLLELGSTHVEFLPLAEHPYGPSWGYQVSGYYAPTARFGNPDDLKYLIDRLHQAGIGVIMDWVPGHFPKDEFALARFDGAPLYEHPDPRRGEHMDWGTLIFDYGQPQVRNFLVANALYWLEEFHVDGLRVDAVASMLYLDYSRNPGEWEPNVHGGRENLEAIAFLQEVNATAYKRNPGIVMIAEESTAFPGVTTPTSSGGLGFGLKWNMGWMNDSLSYIEHDPLYRSHHHGNLTHTLSYAFSEQFLLPISHDEVVHGKRSLLGKMPGDAWQQHANARAFLAYMWAYPGKQLLFMGQEFGQRSEWSSDRALDWWQLDQPAAAGLLRLVGQLNRLYREHEALWSSDADAHAFEWLDASSAEHSTLAFLRRGQSNQPVVAIVNFSGRPLTDYRVGLPHRGPWREILNTDAAEFGGSGVGNLGTVTAEDVPWAGRDASAALTVPPLGAIWLTPASSS